jgi:two-component system, response regulator FlrC
MLQAERRRESSDAPSATVAAVREPLAVDPASRALVGLARRVAAADVTVMLTGESGVGKEVFARFVHEASARRAARFVAVNCAAIPEAMLEATLFGHEKGAFTGASEARPGKFELADGGTLLLDEVTEMPLVLQAKLLRVLQEREVERLGAPQARRVDVRVLATSNRDLGQAVRDGVLREDLYYRLNVFPLYVPPLRQRPADIAPLAERLLARHAGGRLIPTLTDAAIRKLLAHCWPGNVRELENVMQRALILATDHTIDAGALVIELPSAPACGPEAGSAPADLDQGLQTREAELIRQALLAEGGRRKDAAERLGISPRTLRYKLARLRAAGTPVT